MRTLISMSLSGAIVTVVLLVVKPLTRKRLSQRWQYYVWLLVVLRLLLPLAPTVTVPSGTLHSVLTRSISSVVTSVPTTTPVNAAPDTALPTGEPATSTETSPQTLPAAASSRTTWSWSSILFLIWAIGALAVMIWNIAGYTHFKRTVQRTMVRVTDAHVLAMLEACRQEVHARAIPRLYTSVSVTSPILLGVFHPAIVLPDRQLTDNDLRYALLHELMHARRQDGLLKWIAAIAVSIHWFNPLAYVVQREVNRSCELACDEAVTMKFSTDDRRGYGSMLLAVASAAGAPSPAIFSAMVEEKRNLKERLGTIMSSKRQTKGTLVVSAVAAFLIAGIAIVVGCGFTVKQADMQQPAALSQVRMMVKTNVTSSEYDTVLLLWDVRQNTLQKSDTPVLHVNDANGEVGLCWQSGSPLLALQHWSYKDKLPLVMATSKDLNVLVPPVGMQYASATSDFLTRWYVPEESAFVTVPGEFRVSPSQKTLDGTAITITEQGLASGSKAQTLTVPVPSGLTQLDVLYGSGNIRNGFALIETRDKVVKNAADSIWLLQMNGGTATWVRCGDASAFGGSLYSGQDPTFAHVGSLLYFTHGHTNIGCIDTTAALPSVTLPEEINTLLASLYREGPTNAEGPLQAQLASDNSLLILGYPDANWDAMYYAVDASGTVLGSLRADKTSITSFDAKGDQGLSLPFKDASNNTRLPSIDLFERAIF